MEFKLLQYLLLNSGLRVDPISTQYVNKLLRQTAWDSMILKLKNKSRLVQNYQLQPDMEACTILI